MKKIIASVGLFAVGASGVHAASVAALTAEGSKPWSVSATLRGFYDDNVATTPNSTPRTKAFGFEVSPSLFYNYSVETTTAQLSYLYSFRYFDKKPTLFNPTTGLNEAP